MAELKAEVVKIDDVLEHPNADRMELAVVGGYQVCIQSCTFKPGDLAIYIPVDSILPEALEAKIFGPDSKVKLNKHRVRAIKLRGAVSQGMLLPTDYLSLPAQEGDDVTDVLGITKYEPPDVKPLMIQIKKAARHSHPMFSKYTDINHLRKYVEALVGMYVYITEKIHGTNFRCGWVPFVPRTFLQKVKNIFGLNDSWEFVYGSHNVQLMDGGNPKANQTFLGCAFGYHSTTGPAHNNVYKRVVKEHGLKEKVPMGQLWYGEIFGDGIQTGYEYGFTDGEVDVAFMDIKNVLANEYLDFSNVIDIVESSGEQVVPYTEGEYNFDDIVELLNDPTLTSFIDHKTKPVEGFVVRPIRERKFYGGRLILKLLSDAYLLRKDNSDWH